MRRMNRYSINSLGIGGSKPNPECLKKAIRSKALDRSLEVEIPEDVYLRLQKEMEAESNG